ncbi:PA14 domain-containing protein [Paenibacillus sp. HW567]|uniref:PA14 domain-containing protein n=1 Tax=Paenibacillus sp. HW567 TaxID=1034769 RepID=UPI000361E42C
MTTYRNFRFLSAVLSIALFMTALGIAPSSARAAASPSAPVNPDASPAAVKLLSDLYSITGKGIISGQHDYLESPDEFSNKLKGTSGQFAALHGYELGVISGQSESTAAEQRRNVVNSAINWYKNGGIVAMTFHEQLPGTSYQWANVQMPLTQDNFDKYVTPGTTQYNSLIADLDKVAVSLKTLRDAGVPVLWRPYHEMNGNWFWWGKKNNFPKLWNIMYDRFVGVHKLNNLLWVWNPNAPNTWSDPYALTYPGADKVDVLAADIYDNDYMNIYHDSLLSLANGKPIAIGENGQMPSTAKLKQSQKNWVYMMSWGKMLYENNSADTIKSFMNDSYTLTRDKYKAGLAPTATPTPTPTATPKPTATPTPTPTATPKPTATPTPTSVPTAKPTSTPYDDDAAQAPGPILNGLQGEYFRNMTLSGTPALVRNDAAINFNWRQAAPDPALGVDAFSIRWTGKIKPSYSETYQFYTTSDDGIRVYIDGTAVIDSWMKQSGTERTGSIALKAGQLYNIKVEYYENAGDANIRLMWQSPSQAKVTVPASALFVNTPAVNASTASAELAATAAPVLIATQAPAATPVSTATPASTATPTPASTATPTPVSTATPASTATPTPASTATPTPVSTATPIPASAATPIPVSTATPTPVSTATPIPATVSAPTAAPTPTPQVISAPAPAANGLQGEYFNNMQLSGTPALVRNDAVLDFNWRQGSPDAAIGNDFFSVRWSGKIKPQYSETYSFYTTTDDGVRVWVNGTLVIDSWTKQSGTERTGSISLQAGQLYELKMEYYENQGDAKARLMWESPSQVKGTVPANALFLPSAS